MQLTGANTVTAAQAAALAGLTNFSLATGATLVVQAGLQNASVAGPAQASSVPLPGSKTAPAAKATSPAALQEPSPGAPPPASTASGGVASGTAGADHVDLTSHPDPITIDMGGNTAFVSAGLSDPEPVFIGAADTLILGSGPATVQYSLQPSSGILTVGSFRYGLDRLDIDLLGAAESVLRASSISVNGASAISLYSRDDPTHGVVLTGVGPGMTASDLIANHLIFAGGHALIS
ncbi:MAG: hypothetical protein NTY94_21705 [Alphaproteobacteria bacterium]|nr:hypothetical protein [Alphaproteobacteria bacterium]